MYIEYTPPWMLKSLSDGLDIDQLIVLYAFLREL